jgi:2-haloacid dehalogenase
VDLAVEERRRLVGTWHRLDPWPDVRTGLEALRRRRVVAPLSNGHVALLVDLARHADLRFDCVLSAELAHAYKPAPEVYQAAARLLGVEAAELMLVAAHPWDLEGAREAGLRTAFIDRPLEYGPGSAAREYPDADESVGDLLELADRLDDI